MTRMIFAALALACAFSSPALAQAAPATSLEVPWGTWLSNGLLAVSTVAVPIVSGYAVQGIRQVAPWASLFLSNARVESMVQNVTNYGLNAIDGAAKGKVLTVPVGSAVIAKAVQRGIDAAPAAVVKAAGGPQGLAERVFRTLHLEEGANAANTLAPALVGIPVK